MPYMETVNNSYEIFNTVANMTWTDMNIVPLLGSLVYTNIIGKGLLIVYIQPSPPALETAKNNHLKLEQTCLYRVDLWIWKNDYCN